ncbi:MAG TPA: YetF domain-containing protein [Blastocatellia bacterium]|nr:YetF domain-containing protein [Blastocatellia bacterium]
MLMARLREQGVENVEDVKKCYLEGDGRVSVIKTDSRSDNRKRPKRLAH